MNNTHALLLAFIEASGYEVEEVLEDEFDRWGIPQTVTNYKVTKKTVDAKYTGQDVLHSDLVNAATRDFCKGVDIRSSKSEFHALYTGAPIENL